MTTLKKTGRVGVMAFAILICFGIQQAAAQRAGYRQANDYRRLAFMSQHPPIFLNEFTLPGPANGQILLTVTFNISYKNLSFKKVNRITGSGKYFSPAALTLDIFHSEKKLTPGQHKMPWKFHPQKARRHFRKNPIDVSGLSSIAHAAWKDTAYAASYSQTQKAGKSLIGSMQAKVQPGSYIYLLQPQKNKNAPGFRRRVRVIPYNKVPQHNMILVKAVQGNNSGKRLQLMAMGPNVPFGKDFYAFIHLPHYKPGTNYQVTVEKVQVRSDSHQAVETVYKHSVPAGEIISGVRPVLHSNEKGVSLVLQSSENGYAYALIKIPNRNFMNAMYKLTLTNKNTSRPAAVGYYRSYWQDMPASLLNLDVAINMMRYIAPKETIKNISSGSFQQREQKFRKFWKAKDPTPKTPYNELEAEYYARIDSAYQKFTTQNTPGFKTDRGKVYIIYGPPRHKQRTYPTDGPTTIIWTYPSRKFVFKATSGFGDFKLVTNQQ